MGDVQLEIQVLSKEYIFMFSIFVYLYLYFFFFFIIDFPYTHTHNNIRYIISEIIQSTTGYRISLFFSIRLSRTSSSSYIILWRNITNLSSSIDEGGTKRDLNTRVAERIRLHIFLHMSLSGNYARFYIYIYYVHANVRAS